MTSEAGRRRTGSRDAGMTLIEMIVTIAVIGAIVTVLATATTVTFRQQSQTEGNLNVARWEQALALWLPTDLASASTLDPEASSSAATDAGCGAVCTNSSNALTVTYDDGAGTTTVSYRYAPDPGRGDGWALVRVECLADSCGSRVVLRDLAGPEDPTWAPGDEPPAGVISVSAPMRVLAGDSSDEDDNTVGATVKVTVNGLSDASGDTRSSTVSITTGGVVRAELDPPTFDGPDFLEARSGCGGPVTLVLDESSSIGAGAGDVRTGVRSFIEAFEGTPTQLKVITFADDATIIDDPAVFPPRHSRSFDLAESAEVTELLGYVDTQYAPPSSSSTNWLAAMERTFIDEFGVPYSSNGDDSRPAPELVVFFTDGVPTSSRFTNPVPPGVTFPPDYETWRYGSSTMLEIVDEFGGPTPSSLDMRDWWVTSNFLADHRDTTRFVGVGIGPVFDDTLRVKLPTTWYQPEVPIDVLLGDVVAGGDPPNYNGTRTFQLATNDGSGWGDIRNADVLSANDMSQLGSGLAAIALSECGGTLTVQTRDGAGVPADEEVRYSLTPSNEQAATSRGRKAAVFDVPFGGDTSADVELVPDSLLDTPYTAVGWTCRSKGSSYPFDLRTPGVPGDGIRLTIDPNGAVACTLEVG